jgi:YVTN family beta-propeller protein
MFKAIVCIVLAAPAALAQGSYTNFESPQVNPLALSPDGTRLFAANTADARVSVFDLSLPSSPALIREIPVGIEPVSVRARTNDEIWVVNHTSDSISIVSVSQGIVTDTIYCKDEPTDVVFAGAPQRAYVAASRSNAIKVFDTSTHALVATIGVFGENPRYLATSADGSRVFATFALSGNRTTIIPETTPGVPNQPPPTNGALPAPPHVGLIVDAADPAWAGVIQYTMPDNDAVEISTATNTVTRYFPRIGTHNAGIAVRPGTGDLFVANSDSRNLVHFEPGVRGHTVDNRVAKIDIVSGAVTNFDLNPGISYAVLPNPGAVATALASPLGVVFDNTGNNLYVAAFGTDRVARMDANGNVLATIELNPQAMGSTANPRTKRGPRAFAYSAATQRLYVQNRISNTISVIHTQNDSLVNEIPVGAYDPTPATIRDGRGFLYDAKLSGNGTNSCSSCHYDGDLDMIAWDLGDPAGNMTTVTTVVPVLGTTLTLNLHPMKGPMTTQTLKGFKGNPGQNPLHWRGDRTDFTAFNPAFDKLMGGAQLSTSDMAAYKAFVETMAFEPNPNQNLDRTYPATLPGFAGNPATGRTTFQTNQYQPFLTCNTCHTETLGGQNTFIIPAAALNETQDFNVPQLRNMYQKANFNNSVGAQSRGGFGFIHDGTFSTLFTFLSQGVFGNVANDATKKNNLEAFLMCFDTGVAPAVGYSRTVLQANANLAAVTSDVTLLQGQAAAGNIDLIGKGTIDGALRGLRYNTGTANYTTDKSGVGPFTWAQLQAKALAGNATFTLMGVPPGSGTRMGIDRDLDGTLDGDEPVVNPVVNFGASSPLCDGPLNMGVNSAPFIGNNYFALTCTNTEPNALALCLVGNVADGAGTPFYGFNLHVSLFSTELYALDMYSDPSGFGVAPIAIPNDPLLIGSVYAGQTISIEPCAPFGLSASQGVLIAIIAP